MPRSINNEINIAEILKDKPIETKLYSNLVGNCTFKGVYDDDIFPIEISSSNSGYWHLKNDGKYYVDGECMLFPSKKMRDWEKFAWKKGDVLKYTDGERPYFAIFEAFQDEEYTAFKSRYNYSGDNNWLQFNSQSSTNHFIKVSDMDTKLFINEVELHYGGKLNLETLEIEKPKQEFWDGDIVFVEGTEDCGDYIEIFSHIDEDGDICDHASYDIEKSKLDCSGDYNINKDEYQNIRFATEEEKQQLFDALAKEGKAWDADKKQIVDLPKKQIVDLPKKCEFKPFQKVLVRDDDANIWEPAYFSYYAEGEKYPYRMICGSDLDDAMWMQCVAYEGNEGIAFTAKAANDSIS